MTKHPTSFKQRMLVALLIGVLAGAVLFFLNGSVLLVLTMSLSVATFLLIVLGLRFERDVNSPYLLAGMFVRGLVRGQYEPLLPVAGSSEVKYLMEGLNNLSNELMLKEARIKGLETMRIEFVANVSHELRTPLTSIKGYTETLKGGAINDQEKSLKFLEKIEQNTERLNSLISDLLDLSQLESVPEPVSWAVFPAHTLVEKIEATFFPTLEKKIQILKFEISDEQLEGDRARLEQLFINLIDNASRYSPAGSAIEVKEHSDKDYYHYEVIDNGPGISPEHIPRLFERFYRVDKARSRDTGGTGLGLSIVKHIAVSHGGNVTVESVVGKGTRFLIHIPRQFI